MTNTTGTYHRFLINMEKLRVPVHSVSQAFKTKMIQYTGQGKGNGQGEVLPQLGVYLISKPLRPIIRSSFCAALHVAVRPILCKGIWP